jgi:hypothetical protein
MAATTTRYRVIAPCVMVKTVTPIGFGHRYQGTVGITLYQDSLLPADADRGDVDRLLRKGMIEGIEVTA